MQPHATALATTPDGDTPAVPAPTEAGPAALDAAQAPRRSARDAAGLHGGLNYAAIAAVLHKIYPRFCGLPAEYLRHRLCCSGDVRGERHGGM